MKRHAGMPPEVTPGDLEAPKGAKTISMSGAPPNIQPFQSFGANQGTKGHPPQQNAEGLKKAAAIAGAIWIGGYFLGYHWLWPLYFILDLLSMVLSVPPFSWLFGWLWTPLSWIFGFLYHGTPLVEQTGALQEMRLPSSHVSTYLEQYVQQYGDAALIFASHDGYPQIVNGLLYSSDLGYRELIDAQDDNGNTALIYAASKGYKQIVAALLRGGADPDVSNHGRTPLMEAAGGGHKEIVTAIRLSNATIDSVDDTGNTALHYAAYNGHLGIVQDLLKGNARREIKNKNGQTPASYALKNRFKGIADLLSRPPTKREREQAQQQQMQQLQQQRGKDKEALEADEDDEAGLEKLLPNLFPKKGSKSDQNKEKHVKGSADDAHKKDWKDLVPTLDKLMKGDSSTDAEKKVLEDQIAKLKKQHDEAELKAQKRIVELLEKSSASQKDADDAQRNFRTLELNNTELSMKVQDLQSKHQSTELRAMEEKERADRLHEDLQRVQLDVDRHKSRADGAERERDLHMEASRRHEDNLRRKQSEVDDHVSRLERTQREVSSVRDDLRQREKDVREHRDRIGELEAELTRLKGTGGRATSDRRIETPLPPAKPPTNEGAADVAESRGAGTVAAEAGANNGAESQESPTGEQAPHLEN